MSNFNQSIFRKVKKEGKYAQISNELINDKSLSYKALSLAIYILSKPDDWQVYISDLIRPNDGEKSVRSGIKELIENRYMQRYRVYDIETGKVHHWETLVSEDKFDEENLISCVKEKYLKDENGEIITKKITIKNFTRYVPIVLEREEILFSQKGKVEKNIKQNSNFLFSQNVQVEKLEVEKEGQLILNKTKTKKTKTNSSSSTEQTENLNNLYEEAFNKKITIYMKSKINNYIEKTNIDFIIEVLKYCIDHDAKTHSYFFKTLDNLISKNIVTVKDLELSITKHNNSIESKKKSKKVKKNVVDKKKLKTNNFENRNYDYDELENQLLGYKEYDPNVLEIKE